MNRTPTSPLFAAAARAQAEQLHREPVQRDPRQWARDLIARHESGQYRSTPVALAMAREALAQKSFSMESDE